MRSLILNYVRYVSDYHTHTHTAERTIQFLEAIFVNYAVIIIVVIEEKKEYSTSHKSDKGNI